MEGAVSLLINGLSPIIQYFASPWRSILSALMRQTVYCPDWFQLLKASNQEDISG